MDLLQYLVISNPAAFMRGDYQHCFSLFGHETTVPGWINCGPIDVSVDVDYAYIGQVAINEIDEEITKHQAAAELLKRSKAELLAIAHESDKS